MARTKIYKELTSASISIESALKKKIQKYCKKEKVSMTKFFNDAAEEKLKNIK